MNTNNHLHKPNKCAKAPSQAIPVKPHKKNCKLTATDASKLSSFYADLQCFYDANDSHFQRKQSQIKYECFHNEDTNQFYITNFDHQTFHNYGHIHDKVLYLTVYEMLYLRQIALIKLHLPSTDDNDSNGDAHIISNIYSTCNLTMLYLYTYLVQGSKIPKFPPSDVNANRRYDNFILLYENTSSLKQGKLSALIYLLPHTSPSTFSFTHADFHSVLDNSIALQRSLCTGSPPVSEVYLAIYEDNDFTFVLVRPEALEALSI